MSDNAASTLSPWDAVPDSELRKLIELGKSKGSLTVDEVMLVIKDVDMGDDVILAVRQLCVDNGIDLDESEELIEVDEADEDPPARRLTALEVLETLQADDADEDDDVDDTDADD